MAGRARMPSPAAGAAKQIIQKENRNRQSKERRDTYTRHSRREARALLALALGLAAQPHGGAAEAAVFV